MQIFQAISILKQLNQKFYENKEKKSLLDDESENPIILQLTMKKIPPPYMQKFIKVHLPKSTLNETKEVCLITGDLDKRNTKAEVEPDVLHFKELLKSQHISQINEVITLRQLRKEYKPYEARRQLCGAYDVFLCDKKIAGVLPSTLGKSFFKKRKFPIQINMQTPNLKEQIENALSSTVFHITCKGNSCASEVADLSMKEDDILLNIMSSIEALKEQLPGQWDNVLGIYVKTPKSKAIPLFMSNDDPNEFNFTNKRPRAEPVSGELSTLDDADVKVFRDGRVFVKNNKYKEEDIETLSEETGSNDEMKEKEPASDDEVVDNDAEMVRKYEKKSKKRQTKSDSNEESSADELKEEITEDPGVQTPEKKNKKRKPNSKFNVESDDAEMVRKYEKKSKKRQTKSDSNEESSVDEVKEEITEDPVVQRPEKKNKKRKPNSKFNVESDEVKIEEENNKNSTVKIKKSKSKKMKN
nr:ribosomal L1 domain-containing protein 1 isoform X1 [Parasteatoda tepidariorum]